MILNITSFCCFLFHLWVSISIYWIQLDVVFQFGLLVLPPVPWSLPIQPAVCRPLWWVPPAWIQTSDGHHRLQVSIQRFYPCDQGWECGNRWRFHKGSHNAGDSGILSGAWGEPGWSQRLGESLKSFAAIRCTYQHYDNPSHHFLLSLRHSIW